MPNPNGGNLIEDLSYVWADGDCYEIVQADDAEGAASGASFSGLGVDNQPHQVLLNKIKYIHTKQLADEANIGVLQSFVAGFVSKLSTSGYMKIPLADVNRGAVVGIIQWGYYALAQQAVAADAQFNVSWAIPFPNAILMPPLATNVYYLTHGRNTAASVVSYGVLGATFVLDIPGNLPGDPTTPPWPGEQSNGFSYLAIGF